MFCPQSWEAHNMFLIDGLTVTWIWSTCHLWEPYLNDWTESNLPTPSRRGTRLAQDGNVLMFGGYKKGEGIY